MIAAKKISLGMAGLCLWSVSLLAAETDSRALVTQYWQAETEAHRDALATELEAAAGNADTLLRWFRQGPEFASDVPVGIVERSRTDADGVEFPYVILVPESYDPGQSYPVEFMLHGGVGRPKLEPGESLWRGGYDSLQQDDRLVVVPAAWREQFWWKPSQARNIAAILREVRRVYNVDDNRVTLSGVSDGGTGAWFFAFKQPSSWAAFLPYIGHPGVLRSPQSGGGYRLYFENLMTKPLYIVNGENDPLYPAASLGSFIQILEEQGVDHTFRVIEGGGHNTRWLPEERPAIEAFKQAHPRDPFPDQIQWVADSSTEFNRNQWIRIDALEEEGRPSLLRVTREDNVFNVEAHGVERFTLMVNPLEVNLADPVMVSVNGRVVFMGAARPSMEAVFNSVADLDRGMLYGAELNIDVP